MISVRILLQLGVNAAVSLCLPLLPPPPCNSVPMLIGLQLEELYYALYDFITDLVPVDLQLAVYTQQKQSVQ